MRGALGPDPQDEDIEVCAVMAAGSNPSPKVLAVLLESGFDVAHAEENPVHDAQLGDVRNAIATAMKRLSGEHREILMMRHFQDLSYAEIAACLEIPKGTVMSRLHAARRALRNALGGAPE